MTRNLIVFICLATLTGCASVSLPPSPPPGPRAKTYASLPLINCQNVMDDENYWIPKLGNRDKFLLTYPEIEQLNSSNYARGLLTDVFSKKLWDYKYAEVDRPEEVNPDSGWDQSAAKVYSPGVLGGYTLYTYLKAETERIKRVRRWKSDGRPVPRGVFKQLDANLNLGGIRENNHLSYGITRRRTDVRYYPTDMIITSKRWNVDFDIVQVSSIRAMQTVAVLHASLDEKWVFAVTSYCRGWIKCRDLITGCDPRDLKRFLQPERRLVVTGHVVAAVWEPGTTRTAERLFMGTACPLLKKTEYYYQIGLPAKTRSGRLGYQRVFISRHAEVHEGYLPCSVRNIYQQGFKLLHTPYSWGGKEEQRDCSQLVMDLFATMGLAMPRNSSAQALVGKVRYTFGRKDSVRRRRNKLNSLKYPALLQFPGHVMIYIGRVGAHYYALHDIWSYRESASPEKDKKVIIGKVVVSDLSLGQGSTKGSLLERLTNINLLKP